MYDWLAWQIQFYVYMHMHLKIQHSTFPWHGVEWRGAAFNMQVRRQAGRQGIFFWHFMECT